MLIPLIHFIEFQFHGNWTAIKQLLLLQRKKEGERERQAERAYNNFNNFKLPLIQKYTFYRIWWWWFIGSIGAFTACNSNTMHTPHTNSDVDNVQNETHSNMKLLLLFNVQYDAPEIDSVSLKWQSVVLFEFRYRKYIGVVGLIILSFAMIWFFFHSKLLCIWVSSSDFFQRCCFYSFPVNLVQMHYDGYTIIILSNAMEPLCRFL